MPRPAKVLRAASRKPSRGKGDYSSGTKRALVDNATRLFTESGYAGTSLDEVVAAARVTKGALYHHFGSKLALFEAVYDRAQTQAVAQIEDAIAASKDPWERARVGLQQYLEVCQQPTFRRICIQEGPVALGHEAWHESEKAASLGLIEGIADDLLKELGGSDGNDEAFAMVFYGALRQSGEFVADAEDPGAASESVQAVIAAILTGLRGLSEA